jgi:hypothetical protein
MEKQHKFSVWYVLVGVWVVLIAQSYISSMFAYQVVPYSQFLMPPQNGEDLRGRRHSQPDPGQDEGRRRGGGRDKSFPDHPG